MRRLCSAAQQSAPSPRRRRDARTARSRNHAARRRAARRRATRSPSCNVYDRRLRWPVPADSRNGSRAGRSTRVDRRSKYLLFRVGADTLLVHLGMTGSLRVYRERAAAPAARPRRHRARRRRRCCATTIRGASARCSGSPAPPTRIRCCATWAPSRSTPRSTPTTCGARRARARAAIKLALMDNHVVVGVGNIYANEALFRAGIRPTTPRRTRSRGRGSRGWSTRCAPCSTRGDRQGRQHAARLCRRRRRARLLPARLLRLRPRGRAVPRLRHPIRHAPAGRSARRSTARTASADGAGRRRRRAWACPADRASAATLSRHVAPASPRTAPGSPAGAVPRFGMSCA